MPTDRVQHHSQQIPSRPHDHVTHRPMGTLPLPAANAATGFIPASPTPVTGRYTRYQALHPLRGAAPDQKRCNARGSGAAPLPTNTFTAIRSRHTPSDGHTATAGSRRSNRLHPGKHCTRYGALHPLRGATPDQKGCNADGSGAALTTTSTFACAHYPPHSTSAHLSPPPWTPAAVGLTITL